MSYNPGVWATPPTLPPKGLTCASKGPSTHLCGESYRQTFPASRQGRTHAEAVTGSQPESPGVARMRDRAYDTDSYALEAGYRFHCAAHRTNLETELSTSEVSD